MINRRLALTLVEVLVVLAILATFAALLMPLHRGGAGEAARRNVCLNNMKQIGLALLNYHDEHGAFPPAYTVDNEGNRLHSWRALILPYIDEQAVFDTIDFTKPWDDPANEKAREVWLGAYACPSTDLEEGMTLYLAPVGPDWAFSGNKSRSISDIEDGTSKTIAVIEVEESRAVHWMSPHDVEEDAGLPFDSESTTHHAPGIFNATYFDGHTGAIKKEIPAETLAALLTVAGGEDLQAMLDEELSP